VCGGIGHYFDLDPTLIRVLFVLFALAFGGGFLAYIVLWIIIPLEPETLEESAGAVVEEE
jgi:phage shock protein C